MEQLINSLPALLRAAGNAAEVTEAATLAVWNRVVGEGLALQTLALGVEKARLTVAVADSVWQRQLESLSGQLLFRLNALLGPGTIRFIEFRIDPAVLQRRRSLKKPDQKLVGDRHTVTAIPIELISAAATIHDPDLRRAFLSAAAANVSRRESQSR